MGEIFHAMQHLNHTMKLGLTGEQLQRAEASFKSRFVKVSNPNPEAAHLAENPEALSEEYEFVAVLQPRQKKVPMHELVQMADKAVKTNLEGVKLGSVKINSVQVKSR